MRLCIATPADKHLLKDVQPVLLRAIEVVLGYSWSTGIDIWSVGCLVSSKFRFSP
jgi:serine/threonine-protein kinase SRPK3